jgi:2-oxoglutarate ferredoxin oxidoreductase subunit alpha
MKKRKDFAIVLCGEAGQGIQTVEQILTRILKQSGYHIFGTKEYMSRVRGGSNSTLIRVSSEPVDAPVDRIDLLVPLDGKAVDHLGERVGKHTIVIGDGDVVRRRRTGVFHPLPLGAMARKRAAPLREHIAAGVVAACSTSPPATSTSSREDFRRDRGRRRRTEPPRGGEGLPAARNWSAPKGPRRCEKKPGVGETFSSTARKPWGSETSRGDAISCPPTPCAVPAVMVFLARHARDFGIVVEQAEDEIAAVNMALGAWYAGARPWSPPPAEGSPSWRKG